MGAWLSKHNSRGCRSVSSASTTSCLWRPTIREERPTRERSLTKESRSTTSSSTSAFVWADLTETGRSPLSHLMGSSMWWPTESQRTSTCPSKLCQWCKNTLTKTRLNSASGSKPFSKRATSARTSSARFRFPATQPRCASSPVAAAKLCTSLTAQASCGGLSASKATQRAFWQPMFNLSLPLSGRFGPSHRSL